MRERDQFAALKQILICPNMGGCFQRWLAFKRWRSFQLIPNKGDHMVLFASILVFLGLTLAFSAGTVIVLRERMAIDERLDHYSKQAP